MNDRGRRRFLQQLAGLSASAGLCGVGLADALALGPKTQVGLTQLSYRGGNAMPRVTGLQRLAWEVDKRTSVDMATRGVVVPMEDKSIFRHPFLYLGGDQAFALPSSAALARLRRFLTFGGFLLIDSAEARPGGPFDLSVRRLVKALFDERALKKVKRQHTLHKSFYLLDEVVGRVTPVPYLEGVERDGRMALVYTQNDMAGAWARDNFGRWEYGVYPGGAQQREMAFRWGINIVMYALCIDYKADQVHIPFILKRRKWQVR
ncbi:MAG: DUF4159 domain-containing protein [Deltaproteobacteria bacterium]|nr:DUF4159 domain-containing protein [Deltaproteobacteria bacterium]